MRRLAWMLPLLFTSLVAVAADDRTELQNLYTALSALHQEQQAVFQQFQMLQELRRANERETYASLLQMPRYPQEIPNYSDLVQRQRDVVRRGEELSQQADQLYAQYNEIGAKKELLQQRIFELALSRGSAPSPQ